MSCSVCEGHSSSGCPCCEENITCPDCGGSGYVKYTAFDIIDRTHFYVTELAYLILPDSEDMAGYQGKRFCKGEQELCERCHGTGTYRPQ